MFYFHRPPLLSPMILPRRCLAVRGFDLGLDAARAALTAVAAAEEEQSVEKGHTYIRIHVHTVIQMVLCVHLYISIHSLLLMDNVIFVEVLRYSQFRK